ncbi:hypothetical protein OTU49_016447 [Cherax quadricarinatus]|uniref:C2H2-type domain-containing protein n=1 Tax=Cherax quadricarinatus TaxID=27406 RepID=A0AAW0XSL9_CHEQU
MNESTNLNIHCQDICQATFQGSPQETHGKKVHWSQQLQQKSEHSEDTIWQVAKNRLVYYDKSQPTVAITDWSRESTGFVALQQYCCCTLVEKAILLLRQLALCESHHLMSAEGTLLAFFYAYQCFITCKLHYFSTTKRK